MFFPDSFNLHAEQRDDELEEECDFKTEERNINNLHYADDITLIVENANDLPPLVKKVKEHSANNWSVIKY